MKKIKLTKKQIMESFSQVIKVSYCSLQNLLHFKKPSFYTSGKYGWNADVYVINDYTVIVTGYRPFGNASPSYEMVKKYDTEAEKQLSLYHNHYGYNSYSVTELSLNLMVNNFVNEATKKLPMRMDGAVVHR